MQKSKKAAAAAFAMQMPSHRGHAAAVFVLGRLLLHRPGIEALGGLVAIDELDHRHRRVVAVAEAGLEHAGIAAVALLVAGAQHVEQLLDHGDVAHLRDRLAAGVQVAALAERDELLHDRAQLLRLGQGGGDLLVLDQRGRHVGEHGLAVLRPCG